MYVQDEFVISQVLSFEIIHQKACRSYGKQDSRDDTTRLATEMRVYVYRPEVVSQHGRVRRRNTSRRGAHLNTTCDAGTACSHYDWRGGKLEGHILTRPVIRGRRAVITTGEVVS
jgi:hypothetical protein